MAERRVAEIVSERDGFRKVLVEPQGPRNGARNLTSLERVREAVPEMIALVVDEDLGLVLEPPKSTRMHDPVAVALEGGAVRMIGLGVDSPLGLAATHCVRSQA